MIRTTLACLAVALSYAAHAANLTLVDEDTLPERRGVRRGEPRTRAPEARDTLVGPQPVHQDETGSIDQQLFALDGAPDGGFGAIWLDRRQGNLGLYIGLVAADGKVKGNEVPIYPSVGTARQLDPDLAFTDGLTGMLAWRSGIAVHKPIQVRRFYSAPGFRDAPLRFGLPPDADATDPRAPLGGDGRGRESTRGSNPRVAALDEGRSIVAWIEADAALAQGFDAEGEPEGETRRLDPGGEAPTGRMRIASDEGGRALVVWPTAKGLRAWVGSPTARAARADAGDGRLLDAEADPRGGWWLLVQPERGAPVLRRLDPRGTPVGGDLPVASNADADSWIDVDLEPWAFGLGLAVTRRTRVEPVVVRLLLADGSQTERRWIPDAAEGASGARLAAEGPAGERLCVAWTDSREGNADIFYALLEGAEEGGLAEPGAAQRWNTDRGSAAQGSPALDSNGERAWLAWNDHRSGTSRVWMRALAADRRGDVDWAGDERPLPVGDPHPGGESDPVVAMAEGGRTLVAWRVGRSGATRARLLDVEGEPTGPVRELGAVDGVPRLAPRGDGWLLLGLPQQGDGLYVQALAADGAPEGERLDVGGDAGEGALDHGLTRLADGRWLVTWHRVRGERKALAARLLSDDLQPLGEPLTFAYSGRGGDLQAAAAPAEDGGFLLTWTGFESRGRDVVARLFDTRGRPADRPLAISATYSEQDTSLALRLAGGDFAVIWEDDLSGWDQIYARRVSQDGDEMGPEVTLNGMERSFTMGRTGPAAAPLGDGFAVAWVDRSRGLGPDVFVRVVGADFDEE